MNRDPAGLDGLGDDLGAILLFHGAPITGASAFHPAEIGDAVLLA